MRAFPHTKQSLSHKSRSKTPAANTSGNCTVVILPRCRHVQAAVSVSNAVPHPLLQVDEQGTVLVTVSVIGHRGSGHGSVVLSSSIQSGSMQPLGTAGQLSCWAV